MTSNQIEKNIYTVSKITHHIQNLFQSDPVLRHISIVGEISNFKLHSSGHMYFLLKDDQCQIKCVMFRGSNLGLTFHPAEGMAVNARGDIRLYEKRGEYQFYIYQMNEAGKGVLFAAFEALKKKLKSEGLFDERFKQKLTRIPHHIAVITSPTGAAIRDIVSISLRRFPNLHITVVPAQVQGVKAAKQMAENIRFLNQNTPELDFIIIGRGGGSIEELWAFNEEILARAIFESRIPIVSAVGHETDFTISDFVSDLRVPTPSGAAEMTIPDKFSLLHQVKLLNSKLSRNIEHLHALKKQHYLNTIKNLRYQSPKNKIEQHFQTIDDLVNRINISIKHILSLHEKMIKNSQEKIKTLSPNSILKRGYSICRKLPENVIVKNINQVKKNDQIKIRVIDGHISANVYQKEN